MSELLITLENMESIYWDCYRHCVPIIDQCQRINHTLEISSYSSACVLLCPRMEALGFGGI
jgi:hypothetical protein